jgi:hypothetical protein
MNRTWSHRRIVARVANFGRLGSPRPHIVVAEDLVALMFRRLLCSIHKSQDRHAICDGIGEFFGLLSGRLYRTRLRSIEIQKEG